jgi:hypothetical protein
MPLVILVTIVIRGADGAQLEQRRRLTLLTRDQLAAVDADDPDALTIEPRQVRAGPAQG